MVSLPSDDSDLPLWQPDAGRIAASGMAMFMSWARARHGTPFAGYEDLWRWSIDQREDFWAAVWEFCGVSGSRGERVLLDDRMPGARWFPDARLNFAENLLR